jgi:23S rRNA (guanosine2251-2'-O)-methyltransferase
MNEKVIAIYGKHAVHDACVLRTEAVRAVYLVDSADAGIRREIQQTGVPIKLLDPRKLPGDIEKDAVHQGYVAEIDLEKLTRPYDAFIKAREVTDDTAFVILGEIQDPHNVGAIIRSAAAFGVTAVLIPEHRQAQITGSVIKASAGMAFRMPLVSIGNVNHTISDLKKRGFWIYGLDGEATQSVTDEDFAKPSVFILGNEGSGIRQKTLEHCDIPLRIPISQKTESLNASVAAAVVCYEWSKKHPGALTDIEKRV